MAKKKEIETICRGFKIDNMWYRTEEAPEILIEKTFKALDKALEHKKFFIKTTHAG